MGESSNGWMLTRWSCLTRCLTRSCLNLMKHCEKLAVSNPRGAQLIKLCFFTGLTQEQAAQEMEISVAMAERTWALARAWLFREMKRQRKGIA